MTVRPYKESDAPALSAMATASGFPYPDPARVEALSVVVDDDDKPLMACGAERIVQLYLWCGPLNKPLAKLYALRLLHKHLAQELLRIGYYNAEAFLPPSLAEKFGRRLEKTFGWVRNWPSWTKGF